MRKRTTAIVLTLVTLSVGAVVFPMAKGAIRRAMAAPRPALAEYGEESKPKADPATQFDDWLGFRGPGGSGISPSGKPPREWSNDKNLAWKVQLSGAGSSSPIIVGDLVIVLCYSGNHDALTRELVAFDKKTGKQAWIWQGKAENPEDRYSGFLTEHGYASSTPASNGKFVVAVLGKSGVLCVDMAGKELWRAPTGTMSANRRWGSAASPVIVDDMVVVNAAEEARALIAFDLSTGKQRWKAEGASLELCYATPLLARNAAGEDELILGVPNEIWSIRPATGKLRWHLEAPLPGNVSPSPTAGDNIVLIQGGYPATTLVAAPLGGRGSLPRDAIRWQSGTASYVPSGLIDQGLFYCVTDKGQAVCLEAATGKIIYQERLEIRGAEARSKPVYSSLVMADGHLYATTRRSGVFIYPAGRSFSKPAVMRVGDDEDFSATPAVSGNSLYLRSDKALYCLRK